MKGKTLILLMLMFALGIYVISCSLSPAPQQNNTVGNNTGGNNTGGGGGGQTIKYVYIYGQLVSNYTAEWKVLAQKSTPVATNYYGTVDTNDGSFSIRVPENSGSIDVIAYKDNNNNNQYDTGETQINGTNLNVTTNNISNIIIVIPSTNNTGGGGGGPTTNYVHIYGQLVSNYTTEWKVLAQKSTPVATNYYGTVNTNDGSFSISVPENSGSIDVIAYKDNNNNNQYDTGETQINGTNLNVTTNNISNIIIVIPPSTNYSLIINVSNNIYGLRIGIFVYDDVSLTYAYSSSTNATNFSFTVPLTVPTNSTSLLYGIYVDSDNNNQLNATNIGTILLPKEPVIVDPSITFSNTTTNSIVLIPHIVSGSIGGTPIGLNKVMVTENYLPYIVAQDYLGISTISGGSYEIKYYTISNTNTNDNVYVVAFNDANNDNILLLEQGVSKTITNIYDEPSTNTVDFNVTSYTVYINSTGVSGFNKIMTFEDAFALYLRGITNVSTTPFTKTYYKEASETTPFVYWLFKDDNGNGVFDNVNFSSPKAEDTYISMFIDISNQTKITNDFTFATLSVGITITNTNILTNTNLRIQNDLGLLYLGHQIFDVTDTNFTINAYYISHFELKDDSANTTLPDIPFTLTLFNDANDNLEIDSGETIGSATIDPSLGATNITF
jgi:hypothetical protein